MDRLDWLADFLNKFDGCKEIKDLQSDRFYGHVTINFFEGKVVDINKYQTIKPKK